MGLLFPGISTEHGKRGYFLEAELKGAGQAGSFLDGTAAGLMGFLDAEAKKPAPGLAAVEREVVLNEKHNTHIHNAPDRRAMSSKIRAGLDRIF